MDFAIAPAILRRQRYELGRDVQPAPVNDDGLANQVFKFLVHGRYLVCIGTILHNATPLQDISLNYFPPVAQQHRTNSRAVPSMPQQTQAMTSSPCNLSLASRSCSQKRNCSSYCSFILSFQKTNGGGARSKGVRTGPPLGRIPARSKP